MQNIERRYIMNIPTYPVWNVVHKSTVTNVAAARIIEAISDEFNKSKSMSVKIMHRNESINSVIFDV
jgi:hypothetical protein